MQSELKPVLVGCWQAVVLSAVDALVQPAGELAQSVVLGLFHLPKSNSLPDLLQQTLQLRHYLGDPSATAQCQFITFQLPSPLLIFNS